MPNFINKKKIVKMIVFFTGILAVFLIIPNAYAEALNLGIEPVNEAIALPTGDIRVIIARVIQVILSLLGIIALLIVLYGGFLWMTAGGEIDKIDQAKRTLINGGIGLAIVLSAWAITTFILNALIAATLGIGPRLVSHVPPPPVFCSRCSSLGNGIIETHYPPRGAVEVPRNTNIMITFKRPIKLDSIVENLNENDAADPADDTGDLNTDSVRIYYLAAGGTEVDLLSNEVVVRILPDHQTFVFDPVNYLGSPSEEFIYTVAFSGSGLRLEDGSRAFTGVESDGYVWQFTTSTLIDVTPPIVESNYPTDDSSDIAPNVLVQVHFNEAIDPTSIVRVGNLTVRAEALATPGSPEVEPGQWQLVNNYRTAEFVPVAECGINSCGETIYCLPFNSSIDVVVKAATLTPDGNDEPSHARFPYNGVVDAAANSLNDRGRENDADGGERGEGGAVGADDVQFDYSTGNELDTDSPRLVQIEPNINAPDVSTTDPIWIKWNEVMNFRSLTSDSMLLRSVPEPSPGHPWYYVQGGNYIGNEEEPVTDGRTPDHTRVSIGHETFYKAPFGVMPQQGYVTSVTHGVRDAAQNCFVPSQGPGAAADTSCLSDADRAAGKIYCCDGVAQASTASTCHGINLLGQ